MAGTTPPLLHPQTSGNDSQHIHRDFMLGEFVRYSLPQTASGFTDRFLIGSEHFQHQRGDMLFGRLRGHFLYSDNLTIHEFAQILDSVSAFPQANNRRADELMDRQVQADQGEGSSLSPTGASNLADARQRPQRYTFARGSPYTLVPASHRLLSFDIEEARRLPAQGAHPESSSSNTQSFDVGNHESPTPSQFSSAGIPLYSTREMPLPMPNPTEAIRRIRDDPPQWFHERQTSPRRQDLPGMGNNTTMQSIDFDLQRIVGAHRSQSPGQSDAESDTYSHFPDRGFVQEIAFMEYQDSDEEDEIETAMENPELRQIWTQVGARAAAEARRCLVEPWLREEELRRQREEETRQREEAEARRRDVEGWETNLRILERRIRRLSIAGR